MRVLVTGGAGFIGSHICDVMLGKGHQVFAVDNLSSGTRRNLSSDVRLFEADICDGPKLAAVFDEVQPEWVCHHAAHVSVGRSMREPAFDAEVNIVGLLRVLENAVRCGAKRVVFASSGGAMYGDVSTPVDETGLARPMSPYGIAKWVGEQYLQFFAREFGLTIVSLRYANVYGPRQNSQGEGGVVAVFSQRLLAGEPITINGDGLYIRDYVYVTDVARANLQAFERELPTQFWEFNIGTGVGTDVNEVAAQLRSRVQSIWKTSGLTKEVGESRFGPPRPGDLRSSIVNSDRAHQMLGWEPQVSLANGLQQTVYWFSSQIATH